MPLRDLARAAASPLRTVARHDRRVGRPARPGLGRGPGRPAQPGGPARAPSFLTLRDPVADVVDARSPAPRRCSTRCVPPLAEGARVVVHAKPDFYLGARHARRWPPPRSGRSASASCWPGSSSCKARARRRGPVRPGAQAAAAVPAAARSAWSAGAASAAERDVLENARRRWPAVRFRGRERRRAGRRTRSARSSTPLARARPRPRGRRHRASPAAAARSRTCCRSPTRRWSARWPPAARRWSARSATSRTPRCSTWSPTCAPRPRPTRPGGSCPTCARSSTGSRPARARAAPRGRRARRPRAAPARRAAVAAGARRPRDGLVDRRDAEVATARRPGPPLARPPARPRGRRARAHPRAGPRAVPGRDARARLRGRAARRRRRSCATPPTSPRATRLQVRLAVGRLTAAVTATTTDCHPPRDLGRSVGSGTGHPTLLPRSPG